MKIISKTKYGLGTKIEIKLPSQYHKYFHECFSEIERIEKTYSRFDEKSTLSIANKNLGKWQKVSKEFIELLKFAKKIHEETEGNFDITIKSALDSIGYDKDYSFKPKFEKIIEEINTPKLTFDEAIKINEKEQKIMLKKEIDFGGLGKGHAIDKIANLLDKKEINHYYINAGGDIYAKAKNKTQTWKILLEHPDNPKIAIGEIGINDSAIAGTATNKRKWLNEFHHLINPKTKMPIQGCKAIFVSAKTGIEADAYAKGIFCAGFEEGIRISKKLPAEILFISESNKMYISNGFKANLYT
jgi:thiamine biosynthesis lipoprotein